MISVVMAAKNYAAFIPMAVRSVFEQTYTDWELVIIDDGSTDDTPQVVKPFLNDARVRYVRSDSLGQSRAKNLGIHLTRGEFIAFLDADDAWKPTKLEKQLTMMEERVGVVYCLREFMDEGGTILFSRDAERGARSCSIDELFVQNFVCFSSAMVRRVVFEHIGAFDPQYDLAIDYDLWLRVAQHYNFDLVPEPLVLYRTGHGNLSKRLSDRVATAFSIMHRHRREVSPEARAEGYASTARTMAWVLRDAEPMSAIRWYGQALKWPHRRMESLKGIVATLVKRKRPASPMSAVNLRENR